LSSEKVFVTGREEITARSGENQRDFLNPKTLRQENEGQENKRKKFLSHFPVPHFPVSSLGFPCLTPAVPGCVQGDRPGPQFTLAGVLLNSERAPHEIRHLQRDFSGLEN
jgi:hypothetical protein